VLCTKIAEVIDSSKDEVYEDMLQKYGFLYQDDEGYIPVTVKAGVDMSKIQGHWKFYKSNGKFDSYLMIKGTSEYDSAEMAKFIEGLTAYNREQMMKELAPTLEFAKKGMQNEEKGQLMEVLSQVPELAGITDMLPQLERIIASNKWLSSGDMPLDEKYINAYAIAKGVNAINTPPEEPKELTDEELMELYDKNPTFQELVEKKRIEAIKNSQQVPPFSASSGAVNAALNIKEKPKNWDDASKRTREMFGLV
jgi:hypothetical protein